MFLDSTQDGVGAEGKNHLQMCQGSNCQGKKQTGFLTSLGRVIDMKPELYRRSLAGLAGSALMLFAAHEAAAGITGTAHDFKGATTWNPGGQICVVCHTPHFAKTGYEALWNHQATASTFTMYTSSTLDATGPLAAGNTSKMCLSCHDGTVAVSNFGNTTTGTVFVLPANNLGTNLADDHPIGFTYDAALATKDGGLVTPLDLTKVVAGIPLYAGKMECGSCHNVHDNANTYFLRSSNAASALCLKCHNK